jgi:hypothetical protein
MSTFNPTIPGSSAGGSVTQYGVQTPHSSTVLIVTDDRVEAERALDWITDGCVVQRTITYGDWLPGDEHRGIALAG